MALATQCPHCQTTFRVAHDQLKLRAGLVRCGSCKQIFNGVEHLLRPSDAPPAPVMTEAPLPVPLPMPVPVPPPLPVTPSVVEAAASATDPDLYPAFDLIDAPPLAAPPPAVTSPEKTADDPLQRMTLMRISDDDDQDDDEAAMSQSEAPADMVGPPAPQLPDELDEAIEYLQRKPWRGQKKSIRRADIEGPAVAEPSEAPSFINDYQSAPRSRRKHLALSVGAMLLLLAALGQSCYLLRDQIAARWPAAQPALKAACAVLGCRIELLAQIDAVSIESSELAALNPARNTFALNLLLRNRSSTPQRWPSIELTLLDANDRPVIRRVFTERDYLQAGLNATGGFGPNAEQSTRIAFELLQQKASNYRVYLFYP
ncbi:putative Zn finger-like uncharacterized protein [Actimicrobium sp. GrIS 1.19]|uniref:DUF3426 domain-containing protein n=1 Tax=Actimicrobium sp. GrIS 1.19 TaxID=3071708 RepID=UPI002DFDC833|nr:putative Zn finger-like uncharacterized protein [Actimicrobium sp. GrIS 1.19]